MNYKMIVTIYDPVAPEKMFTGLKIYLTCSVFYDPDDYGNGCYLSITGNDFQRQFYDVRYDKSFHRLQADEWFVAWAKNYWSGCYGAWSIANLNIEKLD